MPQLIGQQIAGDPTDDSEQRHAGDHGVAEYSGQGFGGKLRSRRAVSMLRMQLSNRVDCFSDMIGGMRNWRTHLSRASRNRPTRFYILAPRIPPPLILTSRRHPGERHGQTRRPIVRVEQPRQLVVVHVHFTTTAWAREIAGELESLNEHFAPLTADSANRRDLFADVRHDYSLGRVLEIRQRRQRVLGGTSQQHMLLVLHLQQAIGNNDVFGAQT
jgi:hypothetical protein